MSELLIAASLAALIGAPHLLPQARLAPTGGITLWTAALILRACVSLFLVAAIVVLLPATELFALLTHWCLHAVLPFLATHLGFDGHRLGDVALVVPGLILAASLISMAFGLWRSARAVARWVKGSSIGAGPTESVIVAGADVVVAAAGLRTPRVVVSAGALLRLDDAELAAGLEHEWGHVRRRHRFIAVLGEACCALGRILPGSRAALAMLTLHLERDADDYAVRKTGDRLALASAICKAAEAATRSSPAYAALADGGVSQRLRRLVGDPGGESRAATQVARVLATVMIAIALALAAVAPALGSAGDEPGQHRGHGNTSCA